MLYNRRAVWYGMAKASGAGAVPDHSENGEVSAVNTVDIKSMYRFDYSVRVLEAIKQLWFIKNTFSCLKNPKKKHILLYLNGCDAVYTMHDGRKVFAKSGDIVYTAIGSQYAVEFFNRNGAASHTVAVNFLLFDTEQRPFVMEGEIAVFRSTRKNCYPLFLKLLDYAPIDARCPARQRQAIYEIITEISESILYDGEEKDRFKVIRKSIEYLQKNDDGSLPMGEIAALSGVSEIYFRKLFTEYAGISPVKYRILTRMDRAKQYLKNTNLSISEIAAELGFCSPAYFSNQFRKVCGLTPAECRRNE